MSREIIFSVFDNARDNQAKTIEAPASDFLSKFATAEVSTEKDGEAWSPAVYPDNNPKRGKANVQFADVLGFDIDRDEATPEGASLTTWDAVVTYMDNLGVAYAMHESHSASKVSPKGMTKFRVVVPVAKSLTPAEYVAAWKGFELPAFLDSSKVGPESLFYLPRAAPGHEYRSVVRADRPLYEPEPATVGSGLFDRLSELDPYEQVRLAYEKQPALNAAGFAIGLRGQYHGHTVEVALDAEWPKFEKALRENTRSKPVEDWHAAKEHLRRALADGMSKHVPAARPAEGVPVAEQYEAQRYLAGQIRVISKDWRAVGVVAFRLGRFVPSVFSEEDLYNTLLRAAVGRDKVIDGGQFRALFQNGLEEFRNREPWEQKLLRDADGRIVNNGANLAVVFEEHPDLAGVLSKNVRTNEVELLREPPWENQYTSYPCALDMGQEEGRISRWVCQELTNPFLGLDSVNRALNNAANARSIDPVMEWLETLKWDGTPRLNTWLKRIAKAVETDEDYLSMIGTRWLVGAVARTFEPGCQMDNILTLVGGQGMRKTTLFRTIAPPVDKSFSETLITNNENDQAVQLSTVSILELSELHVQNSYNNEKLKSFITTTGAKVRPAYAKHAQYFPRRCVLGATTNRSDGFFTDTENRRFWTITVGSEIDIDTLEAEKAQMWAEAVSLYKAGQTWHADAVLYNKVKEANGNYVAEETFEHELAMYLTNVPPDRRAPFASIANLTEKDKGIAYVYGDQFPTGSNVANYFTPQQLADLLCLDRSKYSIRISKVLTRFGWERKSHRPDGGQAIKVWKK